MGGDEFGYGRVDEVGRCCLRYFSERYDIARRVDRAELRSLILMMDVGAGAYQQMQGIPCIG